MLRHNMMRLFTAPDSCSCKCRRDWDHTYSWSSRRLKDAHGESPPNIPNSTGCHWFTLRFRHSSAVMGDCRRPALLDEGLVDTQ